ncbi:MAG TPA: TM0106 family RecB-like putative nuclease [Acidobacteriaceae bacterium]|nr:TM0106 family RecB-like putative nuclease [Acidobacteriaceae bacterium]
MISATQLYDYVHCPHRVFMDAFGDPVGKDETSPFVELLWNQGFSHENEIAAKLEITTNIRLVAVADRQRETLAAMARHEPLIYGGRLIVGDLVGEPDLLEWTDLGYVPGDIKSGSGFEGDESEGKLKKHYAFQLAHYVAILEQLGLGSSTRTPYIIDREGKRVSYALMDPQGVRNTETWWDSYQKALSVIRAIINQSNTSIPALCAACKLCHWNSLCKNELVSTNDLTLIAELGRASRDAISGVIPTIQAFAASNPDSYVQKKKTIFPRIGRDSLFKFHARAQLLTVPGATAYLKEAVNLPIRQKEVYFDIEVDPMRGVVYLHGFVERIFGQPETATFIPYFANGNEPMHEEAAFQGAWNYLRARTLDSTIYYYSRYERTEYKKLARKYPTVCSVDEAESLFALPVMVDLYLDVVKKASEWPLYDQSIKTLARYLGFQWRDTSPSGAASIEWYNRWIESGDPAIKQRILDYNEDDCLATGVVVDGIRALQVKV